jgi:hypothetical protein
MFTILIFFLWTGVIQEACFSLLALGRLAALSFGDSQCIKKQTLLFNKAVVWNAFKCLVPCLSGQCLKSFCLCSGPCGWQPPPVLGSLATCPGCRGRQSSALGSSFLFCFSASPRSARLVLGLYLTSVNCFRRSADRSLPSTGKLPVTSTGCSTCALGLPLRLRQRI